MPSKHYLGETKTPNMLLGLLMSHVMGSLFPRVAAVLLIESEEHAAQRGARVLAYLAGYGHTTDAFHITAPIESGDVAARAMTFSLRQAGVSPEDVDYVNAHGTSTVLNDITETKAIKRALGERALTVPVSSTKSCTGHLLGAAGIIGSSLLCAGSARRYHSADD